MYKIYRTYQVNFNYSLRFCFERLRIQNLCHISFRKWIRFGIFALRVKLHILENVQTQIRATLFIASFISLVFVLQLRVLFSLLLCWNLCASSQCIFYVDPLCVVGLTQWFIKKGIFFTKWLDILFKFYAKIKTRIIQHKTISF